jgi:hypothetical protein
MSSEDPQIHPEPPLAGDEAATMLGSLERQRATLAWNAVEDAKTGIYQGNMGDLAWSGRGDLNPRPLRPERSALPNCATSRRSHPTRRPSGLSIRRLVCTGLKQDRDV